MPGCARRAARRLAWERLARSLHSCVSSSHRSNSASPNRSRGSISRTTRYTCGLVIRGIISPPSLFRFSTAWQQSTYLGPGSRVDGSNFPQAQQKSAAQQAEGHVVMPACPEPAPYLIRGAGLVLVQPHVALLSLDLRSAFPRVPAFRPLDPEICLEQVLCFKHRRKVDRDNTVRFQLRTLQLLPAPERPSYAGATVEVGAGWSGYATRGASSLLRRPRPGIPPQRPPASRLSGNHWDERWTAHLAPLVSSRNGRIKRTAPMVKSPPHHPQPSPRASRPAVQKARRKGMSLRAIERELGIHRSSVRSYLEAGGPPGWQRMVPNPSTSDTMAA